MTPAPRYEESLLEIDLSEGAIVRRTLSEELISEYLGGRGVAARLLWDRVGSSRDALAPASALIFSTGTLAGTTAPMSGRATVTCVSPATGQYFKSNIGGHFAIYRQRLSDGQAWRVTFGPGDARYPDYRPRP